MKRIGLYDDSFPRLSRFLKAKEEQEDADEADLREEVIKFIEKHPNPEDEELHEWAEGKGYNVHEVEDVMYQLATEWAAEHGESEDDEEEGDEGGEDQIPGGKADDIPDDEFDEGQLQKGIKVEMEHTDDPELAKEIATDHLEEFDNYYDALEEMEEELKREGRVHVGSFRTAGERGPSWEDLEECVNCGHNTEYLDEEGLCETCSREKMIDERDRRDRDRYERGM